MSKSDEIRRLIVVGAGLILTKYTLDGTATKAGALDRLALVDRVDDSGLEAMFANAATAHEARGFTLPLNEQVAFKGDGMTRTYKDGMGREHVLTYSIVPREKVEAELKKLKPEPQAEEQAPVSTARAVGAPLDQKEPLPVQGDVK